MKFELNHRSEEIVSINKISIAALLEYKKFSFPNIVVKINSILIKKDNFFTTDIQEGDSVEAIHMVSGG